MVKSFVELDLVILAGLVEWEADGKILASFGFVCELKDNINKQSSLDRPGAGDF